MLRYALPIALSLFAGCGPTAEERAADAFAQSVNVGVGVEVALFSDLGWRRTEPL
jgi:hypothetical protein